MTERGILFSGAMVRALLAGTKTQTRRLVTPQPEPMPDDVQRVKGDDGFWWRSTLFKSMLQTREMPSACPYGVTGDRLWVREAWAVMNSARTTVVLRGHHQSPEDGWDIAYRATEDHDHGGWRPSIHMPRWASRITLEVTEVRVQRLQDISPDDAAAEGLDEEDTYCGGECEADPCSMLVPAYARLWDSINGDRAPWASNPWVWAVSFKRVTP